MRAGRHQKCCPLFLWYLLVVVLGLHVAATSYDQCVFVKVDAGNGVFVKGELKVGAVLGYLGCLEHIGVLVFAIHGIRRQRAVYKRKYAVFGRRCAVAIIYRVDEFPLAVQLGVGAVGGRNGHIVFVGHWHGVAAIAAAKQKQCSHQQGAYGAQRVLFHKTGHRYHEVTKLLLMSAADQANSPPMSAPMNTLTIRKRGA